MTESFRGGALASGLVAALDELSAAAGAGTAPVGDAELPDVIGDI